MLSTSNIQLTSTKIIENQRDLLNDKESTDVVLVVGEGKREIYCHSFPLLANSKYYKTALKKLWINRRDDGKIVLNHPEFEEETIRAIVEFCYTGVVGVDEEDIPLIYEAADYLEIKELVSICEQELANGLVGDIAAFKFLKIAFNLNRIPLMMHCLEYVNIFGWESFFPNENLNDLSQDLLIAIVTLISLAYVEKWLLIKRWGFSPNDPSTTNNEEQKIALEKVCDVLTILETNFNTLKFTSEEYKSHLTPFLASITDLGQQAKFTSFFSQFKMLKTITAFKIESKITTNLLVFQKISESIVTRHFPEWTQFRKENKRSKKNSKNSIVVANTQNQNKTIDWRLLYRGSENSFSSASFHQLCDGKGPTVTMIKAKNGLIAAAYNSQDWESVNLYHQNPHGFILKIDFGGIEVVGTRFDVADGNAHGTYNGTVYGPTFGGGHDLYIVNNCNQNKESHTNLGNTYKGPGASDTTLFGSRYFQVEEYEVFSVEFR